MENNTKKELIKSNKNIRLDWVDICRGIAIIFVFLGHWETQHITAFAYAFHLSLFFLISGFFAADCTKKYTIKEYFIKKVSTIIIPLMLWGWISLIINHLDNTFEISELKEFFINPASVQANYWFLPALFTVSITYYFLKKLLRKDWIILIISYILLLCFGERAIVQFNVFKYLEIHVPNGYFIFGAIPTYLFWYSLGAISFKKISKFISEKDMSMKNNIVFHIIGIGTAMIASFLLLKSIVQINIIQNFIYSNLFILNNYVICTTIIIIISIIYISTFMEKINCLKNIGKNTMAHMGLEYITHGYFALIVLPMINLGIPHIETSMHVITIIIIQFIINNVIIKVINECLPILNGRIDFSKNISKIDKGIIKNKILKNYQCKKIAKSMKEN